MRSVFPILLLCSLFASAQQPVPPIGAWREHLPYQSAIDVTATPEKVFCATPYSLFSVERSTRIVERYSRVTGLAETGISTIGFDDQTGKLLVACANSNIDILYRQDIYNVPDIKRSVIAGNKQINAIYARGRRFYLSSGIGVIVIDQDRYEVSESWFIGNNGNFVAVYGFTADAGFFYAATEEGLKRAPVTASNLALFSTWTNLSGTNGLPAGIVKNVLNVNGNILAEINHVMYRYDGANWNLFYSDGWPITRSQTSDNKVVLCESQSPGNSRIVILNSDGTINRLLAATGAVSLPRGAILLQGDPWVADQFACLSHISAAGTYQTYQPNSPQGIASGDMLVYRDHLYATAGAVNSSWNYQYNGDGIFDLQQGRWTNTNGYQYAQLDTLTDFISIAIDPRDESVWAGSYGGGLLHLKPGPVFEIFKQQVLGSTVGDPTSYRVAGLCFDSKGNLWVANFGAAQPLRIRKPDGTWKAIGLPFSLPQNGLSQIIVDDNGYTWMVAPLGNGLICYDPGPSIDNAGDDKWRRFGMGAGNGNLPANDVQCIARDKSGFIWVGTTDGIGVIECPLDIFSSTTCDAVWPVVPNGNFAGFLFKGQEVRSIAVDGADRKWVATPNGVFLVSANGQQVIYRFTEDNSPLLSSDVKKITIDGKSGEVFFATAKGICSFRSTATEGTSKNEDVLVFPNPVPPGYSGTIAIRGLVNNAIVKITEPDGRLVYQTRANGGQATWDGRNYKGQRISSGVYLVLVTDEENRKERTAARLFFISK